MQRSTAAVVRSLGHPRRMNYAVAAASAAAKRNFFIGAASSVASFLRSDAAVAEALVWEGRMLLLVQQGPEWLELARYCEREAQRWQQKTPQLRFFLVELINPFRARKLIRTTATTAATTAKRYQPRQHQHIPTAAATAATRTIS